MSFQVAMRKRYRAKHHGSQEYAHLIQSLQQWVSRDSGLLLVQGRKNPRGPIYFATDIVEVVSKSSIPIIWAFPKSRLHGADMPLMDILRMLTVQALQIARPSPAEELLITPSEIENTATDEEWLILLRRALSGLKRLYMVVDTSMMQSGAIRSDQLRAVELLDKLQKESRRNGLDLRAVLTARNFTNVIESSYPDSELRPLRLSTDAGGQRNNRHQSGVVHKPKVHKLGHRTRSGSLQRSTSSIGRVLVQPSVPAG